MQPIIVVFISSTFLIGLSFCAGTTMLQGTGNCGEDTVINFLVNSSNDRWSLYHKGKVVVVQGETTSWKYSVNEKDNEVAVTIHDINVFHDAGDYICVSEFGSRQTIKLVTECKAVIANGSVDAGKRMQISVDRVYPNNPMFNTSIQDNTQRQSLIGSRKCEKSSRYKGYYRCLWKSTVSLNDGTYKWSVVVKTITESVPLSGRVTISSPNEPVFNLSERLKDGREVIRGIEGRDVRVTCTSHGGYPVPDVHLYIDSIDESNKITATTSHSLFGNTYDVILVHVFRNISRSLDGRRLTCRSNYPEADDNGSKYKTVILYLDLKPDPPILRQDAVVYAGEVVQLKFSVTNSRPPVDIVWDNKMINKAQCIEITDRNEDNDVYTTVAYCSQNVSAADNGREVKCLVRHSTLRSPLIASVKLIVYFNVGMPYITGNEVIIANEQNTINLTCVSGSFNPFSVFDIAWQFNRSIRHSILGPFNRSGEFGGWKRIETLSLTPNRYHDRSTIVCEVRHEKSVEKVTTSLSLHYRPLIKKMKDKVIIEGDNLYLQCSATSNPPSLFKWYAYERSNEGAIQVGNGTHMKNYLRYDITNVNRTDSGRYLCIANNGIVKEDTGIVNVQVRYPPDVMVSTRNDFPTVLDESLSLFCNASGVPDTYTYKPWLQIWSTFDSVINRTLGAGPTLLLSNLTYEHSGMYICSVSNGVHHFKSGNIFIDGAINLLVKSYPIITMPGETDMRMIASHLGGIGNFRLKFYSNADPHNIFCFKQVNGSRQSVNISEMLNTTQCTINLPLFNTTLETKGFCVFVDIPTYSTEDFGIYEIVLTNTIGESTYIIQVVQPGPPCVPTSIAVKNINTSSATLSWVRCFHGGFNQTFLIQISTDNVSWTNVTMLDDGRNISTAPLRYVLHSLKASSIYFVRIAAYNEAGLSSYSEPAEFTTVSTDIRNTKYVLYSIPGVAVGIVIILIVAYATYRIKYQRNEAGNVLPGVHGNEGNVRIQHGLVAGPSNTMEMNTVDMIYPNRSIENEVPGRTISDSLQQASDQYNNYNNEDED